ncbi:ABC transporter permease [Anopheles sinensis]|uniref:ABC transporter permease n=1 Tax=Anopheles sinensis TaxID=74873 RepID=A0A084WEB7_ANOSI|nr:ABC transporter permease [Anopheles sinensis]
MQEPRVLRRPITDGHVVQNGNEREAIQSFPVPEESSVCSRIIHDAVRHESINGLGTGAEPKVGACVLLGLFPIANGFPPSRRAVPFGHMFGRMLLPLEITRPPRLASSVGAHIVANGVQCGLGVIQIARRLGGSDFPPDATGYVSTARVLPQSIRLCNAASRTNVGLNPSGKYDPYLLLVRRGHATQVMLQGGE